LEGASAVQSGAGEDYLVIDHVSIAVADLQKSAAFYAAVLEPLGYRKIADRPASVGFGKTYPEFWLNARPESERAAADTGAHICLRAGSVDAVREFHARALASGGRDDGAPGPRKGEMTDYFGAFIRDLDGNKIEAMTIPRARE
jgi:catechol 2,3-dioxygenase-like lactoylglutathione lyase family enzyme